MVYRHIANFWPLVPAVDIQAIYEAFRNQNGKTLDDLDVPFTEFKKEQSSCNLPALESTEKGNINILIVGDGLGCLIKTISRIYRYRTVNINIYVVSNFPESFVRDLLLLSLFNDSSMGILEKAETFLEIFGNTFLRSSTAAYVETKSSKILDNIVVYRQPMLSAPPVWLTSLKQKEIDDICSVLEFLKSKESFDIAKAWENSLRAYFGTRYDSRKNLFDYHFNMKLSQYPIINLRKYLGWCETGIAFKLRKGKYDCPNKTFCVRSNSSEFYIGDIATSPFITYGVECKNETMFQKANNQYIHTSEDISKLNLTDFMTEFDSFKDSNAEKNLNVHLHFYSSFVKTRKYESYFDAVYITCDMISFAENDLLSRILKENGIAVFETVNNVVNSTKDQKKRHLADIDDFAGKCNLKLDAFLKSIFDNFKVYTRKEKHDSSAQNGQK